MNGNYRSNPNSGKLVLEEGRRETRVACFIPANEEHTVSFGESQCPPEESEVLDTQ